jgi:stage V sporulation protein AC
MDMDKKSYEKYVKKRMPRSPLIRDCLLAFLVGGLICTAAETLLHIYLYWDIPEETAKTLVPVTLVFLAALLTGIGVFDDIAKFAGAGTLVPITGFANAVTAPAIENKSEGFIMGVGAKMFTIAGPVIVYGILTSVIYGVIYWIIGLF